ncbi:MAG: thioredoxin family protein [Clostridiales bacterium]|nr:thioredoxin family protein [Clostridiales bacterium]
MKEVDITNFATEVLQSDKDVLLDFSAVWCAPCQILAGEIEKFAAEHSEYKVCKLDIDKTTEIATMFGIMSVPTVVLFRDGKEISRLVGAQSADAIAKFCENNK